MITTSPVGTISPQADFSNSKRKELESQARDEATKDARAKAEQSAKNLGFKVDKVKSVEDGVGFRGIYPVVDGASGADLTIEPQSKLAVQPGENKINYTVTVTYFLK